MKISLGIKKTISALMTVPMLAICLSGCGNGALDNTGDAKSINQDGAQAASSGVDGASDTGQQSGGPVAMGRYVENVTDMSDKISGMCSRLFELADGTLVLTDNQYSPVYLSKDNGESWEDSGWQWFKALMDHKDYILEMAVGADGTAAVIYNLDDGDGNDETGDWNPKLHIIRPDGTDIEIENPEGASYPKDVAVSDDGRVFFSVLGGIPDLYEAKDDGSSEVFLEIQQYEPNQICTKRNLLLLDGYKYKAPLIYDMEKEEYIEDEVLETFLSENYPDGNSYASDYVSTLFFLGEENVVYVAGEKGLHRHVIGGSTMEQVIDGKLSTFSNPAYGIGGMVMLPDNEFLTIFSGCRLVKYVYDKDVPTVPSDKLSVYSLKKNDTIQQAISLYQTNNPDVFVDYEIGMGEDNAVTKDDALKSLNTKIMAGEGPDVLILDDMPMDSYIEKGLLMDMSGFLGSLSGDEELFGNIVDAMKTGDKVYAMPCEILIPVLMGEEKYISMADGLSGIADMVEELRKDNPSEDLLEIASEKGILRFFSSTSIPAWTTEDGAIDKEAVSEYLEQTKRIYDAQMQGLSDEAVETYKRRNDDWVESFGEKREDSHYFTQLVGGMQYVNGRIKILKGDIYGRDSYSNMISVKKVEGYENSKWKLMDGQSSNVFRANTLLGINAASQYTDQAQDFIKTCLGKENQKSLFNGLMVNKAAFDENFKVDKNLVNEENQYLWESSSDANGVFMEFVIYWPNEAETAELKSCIESLTTAGIEDSMLLDAVYEAGGAYFRGEQSLEEAVDAIEKKVALYMAE